MSKFYFRDWHWFNNNGIHRITGTKWDSFWFDKKWINKETWNRRDSLWFNWDWIHKETWTKYNLNGYDRRWNKEWEEPTTLWIKKVL